MLQPETINFFRELRQNNHKDWFDQNRYRYDLVKKDYHNMVGEILGQLQRFDGDLAHLQIKDCTFRINRDIRFAKDKRPYKTHLSMVFTPYGRKMDYAGYYVHLDEVEGSFVGGGIYKPPGEVLKKVRYEMSVFYEDLQALLDDQDFKKIYGDFDRTADILLTRPPKGYAADDPALEYLKLKSFTASRDIPASRLRKKDAIEETVHELSALRPLIRFLNRSLRSEGPPVL